MAPEGINFTLPEVQTLLQGVTVGGHRLSDQQIAVNQGEAWKLLFRMIREGGFSLSADCAMALHAVAAREEALEWGCFRSGSVLIAGTDYEPPAASELPERFDRMIDELQHMDDVYDQAVHLFLTMARKTISRCPSGQAFSKIALRVAPHKGACSNLEYLSDCLCKGTTHDSRKPRFFSLLPVVV